MCNKRYIILKDISLIMKYIIMRDM